MMARRPSASWRSSPYQLRVLGGLPSSRRAGRIGVLAAEESVEQAPDVLCSCLLPSAGVEASLLTAVGSAVKPPRLPSHLGGAASVIVLG